MVAVWYLLVGAGSATPTHLLVRGLGAKDGAAVVPVGGGDVTAGGHTYL